MPALHRLILLACALPGVAVFALLGAAQSGASASQAGSDPGGAFWMATGAIVFSPLWLPAIIPARHCRLMQACQRAGAIGCALPLYLFGSSAVHQLDRWMFTPGHSAMGLLLATAVLAGCAIGAWLLWRCGTPPDRAEAGGRGWATRRPRRPTFR